MVDAGQAINVLSHLVDDGQRLVGKDGAAVYLDRDDNLARTAEGIANLVVQLDVGMLLRQQVRKLGENLQPRDLQRKKCGDQKNGPQNCLGRGEDQVFDLVQRVGNLVFHGWPWLFFCGRGGRLCPGRE